MRNKHDRKRALRQWTSKVIKLLHKYSTNMWEARNELTHGRDKIGGQQKKLLLYHKQTDKLYGRSRRNWTSKDINILKLLKTIQKNKRLDSMNMLIEMTEMIFQMHDPKNK